MHSSLKALLAIFCVALLPVIGAFLANSSHENVLSDQVRSVSADREISGDLENTPPDAEPDDEDDDCGCNSESPRVVMRSGVAVDGETASLSWGRRVP